MPEGCFLLLSQGSGCFFAGHEGSWKKKVTASPCLFGLKNLSSFSHDVT